MPTEASTDRVRSIYERTADRYDRSIRLFERVLKLERGRRWVCSRAEGGVLEVGMGTGRNLAYYPPKGIRLAGVDLSPAMLEIASRRAASLGTQVQLHIGDAQALEFPGESFDTVVFGLSLCSIPDDRRAVSEAKRVLRPGGRLLLLEHVRSSSRPVRAGQRLIEPLAVRFQADHLLREPLDHVLTGGMKLEEVERWAWGIMECASARKPA